MPNKNLKNPFEAENWFSKIIARDQNVQVKIKQTYRQFLQKNPNKNIFMSLKNTYLQIINSITKHAVLATLIMLVALGGVGASAAELLAPQDYKPSNIIKSLITPVKNQVPDTDPFTKLKPDNDYDVVSFDECDLAIKYPKKIGNKDLGVMYGDSFIAYTEKGKNPIEGVRLEQSFSIECMNKNDLGPINFETKQDPNLIEKLSKVFDTPKVYADSEPAEQFTLKPITKEDFKNLTGWFIFEGEVTDIYEITSFDYAKIDPENEKFVRFTHKDKVYFTYFETARIERSGGTYDYGIPPSEPIEAKQIQLQFNSLAASEINAKIVADPESTTQNINSELKYLSAQLEDGGETWTVFLENQNKEVYMVKGVRSTEFFSEVFAVEAFEANLNYFVSGQIIAKKQVVPQMEGTPDQKVDYEFTKLDSAKFITANNSSLPQKAPNTKLQTYTNQYFPNFKLVYDSSWKFETKTNSSEYKGVLSRQILLTKKNATFTMYINPKIQNYKQISDSFDMSFIKKIDTISNDLIKYSIDAGTPSFFYGKTKPPIIYLTSNIKATSSADYQAKTSSEDRFITFITQPSITYFCSEIDPNDEGPCLADKVDEQLQKEIDQIISQSSFK